MKTKVKATTSFMHGRIHAHLGDEIEVTKGEADELIKAGMAHEVVAQEEAAQPAEAPAEAQPADDVDDLLGGEDAAQKMDGEVENKMEPAVENKGVKTPKAKGK